MQPFINVINYILCFFLLFSVNVLAKDFHVNLKELSFDINNLLRLDIDGYMYMGPFYASSPHALAVSSTYSSSYRMGEVVTGFSVANGGRTIRPIRPYKRGNEFKDEYARVRPWFHLYVGDHLSFHSRIDFMTGRIGQGENYNSNNVVDFGYFELKVKGYDIKLGMLSFYDPLNSDWGDPNNLVLANNGGMGINGNDYGEYWGHRSDGYEGVLVATDDVFKPLKLRLGYFNMGHKYFSDEINVWTTEILYEFNQQTSLKLYEYVVMDKDNTQFPGLGGEDSRMYYTGVYLVDEPEPIGFTANFVYLGGTTKLESRDLRRSAWASHFTLDYKLGKETLVGLKFTHTTGDNNPYDNNDNAWWGLDADYYETYMFYDYGWAETLNYQATVIDPNTGLKLGTNLVGPYLKTTVAFISRNLKLDAGIYQIMTTKKSPERHGGNGNRNVGTEFDMTFEYFFTKQFSYLLELDYINVSDLYDDPSGYGRSPNAWAIGGFLFYYF